MPEWTPEQERAITLRGGNVLCAAAAGAGKTAVLTERVVRRVADPDDPLDIDQLLIVTFTRAAAAEMRRRISAALRAAAVTTPRLRDQVWRLPQADITTLHGFCERTLRRSLAAAGPDPGFRLLDPAEARVLQARCLRQELERGLVGPQADALADALARYGGRWGDHDLEGLVHRLDRFAQSQDDPAAWLDAQRRALEEPDLEAALQGATHTLRDLEGRVRNALRLASLPGGPGAYLPALEADLAMLVGLREAGDASWDTFAQALASAGFGRLPASGADGDPRLIKQCQRLRDEVKQGLARLAHGPHARAETELRAETRAVAGHLAPLLDLVAAQRRAFQDAKARLRALDFDDLEHGTARLLADPQGRAAVSGHYREVLVDEAQDLSPVQDTLLEHLCAAVPLFCVGDARQSIYGFRQAEPRRFLRRSETYAQEGRGHRVSLLHNFRSRGGIIAAVNFLFDPLFRSRGSGLPPADAGPLVAAAAYQGEDPPVELHLLDGDTPEAGAGALENEADAVATLVERWLATARVQEGGDQRPARPGDAAVLLRTMQGQAPAYVAALRARGLPVWSPSAGGLADTPEGRTLLSWLETLENPLGDIPLAATLRGPFGGFSDADLAAVRLALPRGALWDAVRAAAAAGPPELRARLRDWLDRLGRWREAARQRPFGDLVSDALEEIGYREYVGGLPGGAARRRTLNTMVDRCRQADRLPHPDISQLITFLAEGDSGETVAEAAQAAGDTVRLLSIHGSKGLEFPLVVVAGLGRSLPLRDAQGNVLAHRDAGLGACAVDLERRLRWPTVRRAAVAQHLVADARAEELRVLYVALTRARERLALVGTLSDLARHTGRWLAMAGTAADLADGSCPLDWFGPRLARHPDVAPALAELSGGPGGGRPEGDSAGTRWTVHLAPLPAPLPPAIPPPQAPPAPEVRRRLEAEATWRYPAGDISRLAAKMSVGQLSRWTPADGEEQRALDVPLPMPRLRPSRGGPTAAEAGSATHLVLAHLDMAGPCDGAAVQACVADLVRREVLRPELAGAVARSDIVRFLAGTLGGRVRRAALEGTLRREVPFTLRVSAGEVHPGADAGTEDWVLVQGVIDVLAREGDGLLLVDYKTDRLRGPDDLARQSAHHAHQVRWYARAARAAWGLPVRDAILVFLTGALEVPVAPP